MELSQAELEEVLNSWSMGSPSPFYKRGDRLRSGEPIRVAAFSGEEVRWIGKVDTDMFSSRGDTDFGVYTGISPYRVVFYRAASVFSDLCRSYWFEVDVGGRTWQRGRVRKREHKAIGLARPRFRKGIVSRQITIGGLLTRADGKEESIFRYELSDLEWLNPQTGEFQGGKGRSLYDQLIEAYDNRIPISVADLWLMERDTSRAILTTPGQAAEGRAVRTETPEPSISAQVVTAPAVEEAESEICPRCGSRLKPGIQFCGKCGHRLGAEPVQAGAQVEAVTVETAVEECPGCGHPLRPGIQFCGKCGHRLEAETPATEQPGDEVVAEEETSTQGEAVQEVDPDECPDCGKPVEEGWRACPHCGARLTSVCPECGRSMGSDWVACPYCGARLGSAEA